MSQPSISSPYSRSPAPAFPPYSKPPSTPKRQEQSSIFRIQKAQKRIISSLPPHAYQQNSIDTASTQITALQLPPGIPPAASAPATTPLLATPTPVASNGNPLDVIDLLSKTTLNYFCPLAAKFWSQAHIHASLPYEVMGSSLFAACASPVSSRYNILMAALNAQPSDLSCLTILTLISKVYENQSSQDKQIFQHPIFNRSIGAFTPTERSLFVRVLSLANFPLSQELRNLFQHHFFQIFPGRWVSEEEKINYVLEELKKINADKTNFNRYEFDFDKGPLAQRLPQTIQFLQQRCLLMLKTLKEGIEVHLPACFFETKDLTADNFPTVAPSDKTTLFDPTKHITTLALPRYAEFSGYGNIPICTIEPRLNQIEETSICAIIDNYFNLEKIMLITSVLDPTTKIALMSNWECALLRLILKNSNYNLESKPMLPVVANPARTHTHTAQPVATVSSPTPVPTTQLNVASLVSQVATAAQVQTTSKKRTRSDLTNKEWQPNQPFCFRYSKIEGDFLKCLKNNKIRTIDPKFFKEIENFPDLTPNQNRLLQELFKSEQYRVNPRVEIYQIPVGIIVDILENKRTTLSPNLGNRRHPPLSQVTSSSSSPSSSTSSSPRIGVVSSAAVQPPIQTQTGAKQAGITFLPPDKIITDFAHNASLDRLFEIRKTAEEKTLTREQQVQVFVHRQLADTLIGSNSQIIMERSRQKLPDDFFDTHTFLKPMRPGEVGESFWASQAYTWFDINRFIQTAYEMPETFREATKEGLMNTYYRQLVPSVSEIKTAHASISIAKNRQEVRLKKVLELFDMDLKKVLKKFFDIDADNLEDILPPTYRHTWDDFDRDNLPLLGEVVGYHPEFEFNFKTVQTLLYHTILSVRTDTLCQQFNDSTRSHSMFIELIALELLKNAKPASDAQLLFRDSIVCTIPHHDTPWSEEQTVFVDFNTFDRANTLGLNARLIPNEPLLLWQLYNALDDFEKSVLEECIRHQDPTNPFNSEKVSLVYEFLREFADAINNRYILVNAPQVIPERRSSPIKYVNMAITKALKGLPVAEIEKDPLFERSVWKLPTQ